MSNEWSAKKPNHAGWCGFWCRLRVIFSEGDHKKTVPAPSAEIGTIYNVFASGFNFTQHLGYLFSGHKYLLNNRMPLMSPRNKRDAEDMQSLDMALLFLPEIGEEVMVKDGLEIHHLLPKQFEGIFKEAGLEVEEFTVKIRASRHRLRSGPGLHTIKGGDWNGVWQKFLDTKANRTVPKILDQMYKMIQENFWTTPQ